MKKSKYLLEKIFIVLFIILIVSNITFAEDKMNFNDNDPYVNLGATYSFYLITEFFISESINAFPNYRNELLKIKNQFNYKFGSAFKNIEKKLLVLLEEKDSDNLKTKIINDLKYEFDDFKKLDIDNIITNLERTSRGIDISPQILKTFFIYDPLYKNHPEKEIIDGYYQEYYTKNHKKANGLNLKFNIPLTWRGFEGERPHIIQKFISENGGGLEMFQIYISENIENVNLNEIKTENFKTDILKFIENTNINFPSNIIFGKVDKVYLDNIPFIKIRYNLETNSGPMAQITNSITKLEGIQYLSFYKDYQIIISFSINNNNYVADILNDQSYKVENSLDRFDKYENLFTIIANSMILYNQWELSN